MLQHCPSPRELDDLELLVGGAYAPQMTFGGPLTLDAPAGALELVDPEGFALAVRNADGSLQQLATPTYGAFRRLHLTPVETRARYGDVLTVPVAGPLTDADLAKIAAARAGRPVLLLALCGTGTPQGVSRLGLIRATLAGADLIGDADVVAVPLPSHGDAGVDHELGARVVANYAPGEVLGLTGEGDLPAEVAAVVDEDQPDERGLVVFFTGLSGSGKSTLARALHDHLLETTGRRVTTLDGDVVRRHLSAGLGFSQADRETNIRRIGWVAAEIGYHLGVAICSPIAPFDATRKSVRAMVEDSGADFVLVHVATPLEECERRDRKGLYAKARAGEIADFTGISSPYEVPADADVVVDTTGRSVDDVLTEVLAALPVEKEA